MLWPRSGDGERVSKIAVFGQPSDGVLDCGNPCAPIPLHRPVDELHQPEIKRHTGVVFLLTLISEGVKRESFFDSF
jgi:hypothetical protein